MKQLVEIAELVCNKLKETNKDVITGQTLFSAQYIITQINKFKQGDFIMASHFLQLLRGACKLFDSDIMSSYVVDQDSSVEVNRGLLHNKLSTQQVQSISNKVTANKITL